MFVQQTFYLEYKTFEFKGTEIIKTSKNVGIVHKMSQAMNIVYNIMISINFSKMLNKSYNKVMSKKFVYISGGIQSFNTNGPAYNTNVLSSVPLKHQNSERGLFFFGSMKVV